MSQYIDKYIIAGLIDCHGNVHWEDIDDIPIADVRENVKGEWIKTKYADTSHYAKVENYECNICKTSFSYHTDTESRPNFCQNCGADMRGEE